MYWLLQPDGDLQLKSAEGVSVFLQQVEGGFIDLDRQTVMPIHCWVGAESQWVCEWSVCHNFMVQTFRL
jgi:hypothetical protein